MSASRLFGALGDPHGDTAAVAAAMTRHPDVPFWVCPGDLGGDEGRYADPPAPLYWIQGNNEDFDVVARFAAGARLFPNLYFIANGTALDARGLRIAGLGGTLAPTWYDTPAAALPAGTPTRQQGATAGGRRRTRSARLRDKRRHFVREEVERCAAMSGIDLFLTHEAPRPFFVGASRPSAGRRGMDAGKAPINDVLRAMRPRLHIFGHHHRFDDRVRDNVRSIGLEVVSVSYLLIDAGTMEYERIPAA